MGSMKKIALYAMETLGLSLKEVTSMSLKELNEALIHHETGMEDSLSEIKRLVEIQEAEISLINSLDTYQQNKRK